MSTTTSRFAVAGEHFDPTHGGTVLRQIARLNEAESRKSASHSPAIAISPALFSSEQAAQYLGMSEAKFHELRGAEWM